ncbi:polyprenyl synthetase family protein [bacterium]|nr:polyprenyl synthetase family protein [bacterium]
MKIRKASSKSNRASRKTVTKAAVKKKSLVKDDSHFNLKTYLASRGKLVDEALNRYLPRKDYFPAKLHAAVRHSMFSGGKRLRPILVIAAAEACGSTAQAVMPAACALECIHTYSLMHDDLPAMDDDALRRGQPTCHKIFGEAAAILAGDALLTFAFELMGKLEFSPKKADEAEQVIAASRILAKAAGMAGMVGGQMADIDAEGQDINLPMLQYIHTHKTGQLIQAALKIGGCLAKASSEKMKALSVYGETIGLAFQISDDVLNVIGEMRDLGKSVGTDEARGKATYPALFGLEESKKHAETLIAKGLSALKVFGKKAAPLTAIANYVTEREV